MKRDNRGVSFIEIIIVITILAILSTGALSVYHQIGYANTTKASKTIQSVMNKVRMETMSKQQKKYLYLYNIGGSIYMKVSEEADPAIATLNSLSGTKLIKNSTLQYKMTASGVSTLGNGLHICISFVRSSGAFDLDYEYIKLINASNETSIYCVQETGRHWVE